MAEDKLTAILWLKHWLRKESRNGTGIASVIMALEMLEDVFRAGDIYDWSTNDWLCVRVLETIPIQYPSLIERLMDWVDALSIWQRRSALLAFKKSAKQGQHHKVVEALIERFCQPIALYPDGDWLGVVRCITQACDLGRRTV